MLQDLGLQMAAELHNLQLETLHISVAAGTALNYFDIIVHTLRELACY